MKIAMLGHKRVPSREGGIEVVVEELAVRMVELGHEVTCYNRKGQHVSGKEFNQGGSAKEYKGIKLKSVFTIDKRGLAAMSSSFFGAIKIAFSKCDVVHFHAEGPCAMLWIPKLFRKRCVVTIHGLDWQRSKWGGFATKYIKFGEKVAAKYADEIIVLSENVRQYFKDVYGREAVFIPNGVNKPICKKAEEIKKNFALEKDAYILYLGRIVPEKGAHYLIKAFKELDTNKKLVIAGGASDTDVYFDELKKLASGDERILFTGFVSGVVLEELYSNAYIYALPSDLEGMPLSLLEAMSYGNCVIGSSIPEISEVVENEAVLFTKSDISSLLIKLQSLLNDEKLVSRYKECASDYICDKYNWDEVTKKTLRLYRG